MLIYIIFIVISILSFVIQQSLNSKFQKYSRVALSTPLYGKDVAQKMLRDNGITDVQVISTRGSLTDHFNPANKTVNLSMEPTAWQPPQWPHTSADMPCSMLRAMRRSRCARHSCR